ncbi:hypothetical protein ACFLU6_16550 [Acidobacteriota bacterium]
MKVQRFLIGAVSASVLLLFGCNVGTAPKEQGILFQDDRVSGCGGFAAERESPDSGIQDYCDAEILTWNYDRSTWTLRLSDNRVLLNCCGHHSMNLSIENGVYLFTETDDPGKEGRCLCMCVYDFTITVHKVPERVIHVLIQRIVTDEQRTPSFVFEGDLDLSIGSGSVVIDRTDVGQWCE